MKTPRASAFADDERLWSAREVAAYLGVAQRTLSRLRIPRITIPGSGRKPIVRYDPKEVKTWVDAWRTRRVRSSPGPR